MEQNDGFSGLRSILPTAEVYGIIYIKGPETESQRKTERVSKKLDDHGPDIYPRITKSTEARSFISIIMVMQMQENVIPSSWDLSCDENTEFLQHMDDEGGDGRVH